MRARGKKLLSRPPLISGSSPLYGVMINTFWQPALRRSFQFTFSKSGEIIAQVHVVHPEKRRILNIIIRLVGHQSRSELRITGICSLIRQITKRRVQTTVGATRQLRCYSHNCPDSRVPKN